MLKFPCPSKRWLLENSILSAVEAFDKNASPLMVKAIAERVINFFYDPDTCIADVWHFSMVQEIRQDLSEEQAMQILWAVYKESDSEKGINTSVIESWADALFPLKEEAET
jgi:hypothetical protein